MNKIDKQLNMWREEREKALETDSVRMSMEEWLKKSIQMMIEFERLEKERNDPNTLMKEIL